MKKILLTTLLLNTVYGATGADEPLASEPSPSTTRFKHHESRILDLQIGEQKLVEEITGLNVALYEAKKEIARAENDVGLANSRATYANTNFFECQQELARAKRDVAITTQQNENLRSKYQFCKGAMDNARRELEEAKTYLEERKAYQKSLEGELEHANGCLFEERVARSVMVKALEDANHRVDALRNERRTTASRIMKALADGAPAYLPEIDTPPTELQAMEVLVEILRMMTDEIKALNIQNERLKLAVLSPRSTPEQEKEPAAAVVEE